MRRIAITGLGLVTPLGVGCDFVWKRLLDGKSGIRRIEHLNCEDLSCKIAGMVPGVNDELSGEGLFNPGTALSTKEQRKVDSFTLVGMVAADEAIAHSDYTAESEEQRARTGVMIGSGIGGLTTLYNSSITTETKGARRLSPFTIPASLINICSGHVAIKHGFKGPNHSVVTACSSGTHAIGDAARLIALGDADAMLAGGAEDSICRLGLGGFAAARALSTGYNDQPEEASRPWDRGRDGFVMGAGAGMVMLEEMEAAKKRGATIYAELVGYGLSGDAYHITAPSPDGDGAFRAMEAALNRAGFSPERIDYINAHGTSTPLGDMIEYHAVKRLFGAASEKVSMSSTKSAIGHLLGAAGAVETVFSILAMRDQVCPPTLNLRDPEPEIDMDLVPLKPRERKVDAVLTNSFGFGGTNASLVLQRV